MEKKEIIECNNKNLIALALTNILTNTELLRHSVEEKGDAWIYLAFDQINDGVTRLVGGLTGNTERELGSIMVEYAQAIIDNSQILPWDSYKMAKEAIAKLSVESVNHEYESNRKKK